jgi:tetratricopeptide (TPR) repeat protein
MVEYERVLELDPTHARAWNNLGLIYRRAGLIETTPERTDEYLLRSLEFFSRSVKEDPQLLEPRVNRCATLVDLRRLEEAQTSLLELVQLSQASEPSPQTTQAIDVLQRKLAALAPRASEPQAPLPVQPDRQTSRAEGPH